MHSNYILVYGSLRKGEYNFNSFKSLFGDEFKYVKTMQINGYDLFSLGAYPAIKEGKGDLIVDLINCSDECKNSIDRMELGAGYTRHIIEIDKNITATLYVYLGNPSTERIVSGDWSEHLKKEKNGETAY